MSSSRNYMMSDRSQVRPVLSVGGHGSLRTNAVDDLGKNNNNELQTDERDGFAGVLNAFERDFRVLAEKLADECHLQEKASPSSVLQFTRSALEAENDEEDKSYSATAVSAGVTETRATTTSPLSAATGNSFHRPPLAPPSATKYEKRTATGGSVGGGYTCDTSCVQIVALNVWATLGFFSLPQCEGNVPVGGNARRSLRRDSTDMSSPSLQRNNNEEEEEKSIFAFVEALAGYYQRELAITEAASAGKTQSPLSDEMLRNGLWLLVFNALFYCVTAPGTALTFTPRDLECLFGGTEDLYDVVNSSSSSMESDENRKNRNHEGEEDDDGYKCVPTKLHWSKRVVDSQGKTGSRLQSQQKEEEEQSGSVSRRPSSPSVLRGTRRYAEFEAEMDEEGQSPFSSSRSAGVSIESSKKHAESMERSRHHSAPFGGRLAVPPTITLWHFVLHTFAQLGYRRDAFYVQTPLHGSIHELMLALLWLTKECQLVAVAEYVQLQSMYPFLLQQGAPVSHDGNHHSQDHDCSQKEGTVGVGMEARHNSSATLHDSDGEALLRCFPSSVPWPPASFVEKEHISHRLDQIRRILPTALDERDAPKMNLSELTRRLLSMQRLVALSMNRLECALHQRTEQTVALGLHSTLDAQLCHPSHHGAYRQLCAGLQHLRGMETRVRETTQQLLQLGSLVARAVRLEAASQQQRRHHAAVVKALENDEATWWQQLHADEERKTDGCERWNLNEAFTRFRATGTREHLTDLWASLRRRAQVGGRWGSGRHGTSECFAENTELQAQLEEKVRENMECRYSLDAALKAELLKWQLSGAETIGCADAINDDDEKESESRNEREAPFSSSRGLRSRSETAQLKKNRKELKKVKPPFMPFELVTSHIPSHRPQATAVGKPAANATTSARLEMERLHEALAELDQQLDYRVKRREEREMEQEALELLRQHGLRVVPRKR